MLENALQRGQQLQTGLRKLQEEYEQIGDVRGLGLMIGSEFEVDGKFKQAKPLVKNIVHAAEERGLMLLSCGTYDSTIRWIPPLNVTESQISNALKIFAEALKVSIK
jgi:4-aminobutyrate aminotransferase-like enzyme